MMTCKNCKHGKYNKATDTVVCRLIDRTLLTDRADNCDDYEFMNEVKRYQERMKARDVV